MIVLTQLWLTPGLTAVCSYSEWASVQAHGEEHTHTHRGTVNVLETSGTGAQLSALDAIRFSFSFPSPSICLPAPLLEHLSDFSASRAPLLSLEKEDWVFDVWICYIKKEGILLGRWT